MTYLPYIAAAWLVVVGLYGVVTSRNLVHAIICIVVLQASTYLLLIGIGARQNGVAPVFVDVTPRAPAVDPLVQAMMLTDIVVEATVMALLLALAIQAYKATGTLDPDELRAVRG